MALRFNVASRERTRRPIVSVFPSERQICAGCPSLGEPLDCCGRLIEGRVCAAPCPFCRKPAGRLAQRTCWQVAGWFDMGCCDVNSGLQFLPGTKCSGPTECATIRHSGKCSIGRRTDHHASSPSPQKLAPVQNLQTSKISTISKYYTRIETIVAVVAFLALSGYAPPLWMRYDDKVGIVVRLGRAEHGAVVGLEVHHGCSVKTNVFAADSCRRGVDKPHIREGCQGNLLARVVKVFDDPFGIHTTQLRPVVDVEGYRVSPIRVGDDSGCRQSVATSSCRPTSATYTVPLVASLVVMFTDTQSPGFTFRPSMLNAASGYHSHHAEALWPPLELTCPESQSCLSWTGFEASRQPGSYNSRHPGLQQGGGALGPVNPHPCRRKLRCRDSRSQRQIRHGEEAEHIDDAVRLARVV